MFPRINNIEFPFNYLLSINFGECRLCDYNGGTMDTIPDIYRLQHHYSEQHPVTKHLDSWTQKISDQLGEKTIAIFHPDRCNQDDCKAMRLERKQVEQQQNGQFPQQFEYKMKVCMVKSHASFFPGQLDEPDLEQFEIFFCIDHFNGVVIDMINLFGNFGLMYMFQIGMDNPKLRQKYLPLALIRSIKAKGMVPKNINVTTTCASLPNPEDKETAIAALSALVRNLQRKNLKLKTINIQLQRGGATNSINNEPEETELERENEELTNEQTPAVEEEEEESSDEESNRQVSPEQALNTAFDNLIRKINNDTATQKNPLSLDLTVQNSLLNKPSTSKMADLTSTAPPLKKIKMELPIVVAASTPKVTKTSNKYTRRKLLNNDTDKPFQCDQCDGAFGHKQSLARHKKQNHNNTN